VAKKLSRRTLATYVADRLIAGDAPAGVVMQLAAYLVESRRTKELGLIVRDVAYFLAEKGTVHATITSAFDLSAETQKAIEAFIKEETGGTTVSFDTLIDPTVLGGVKISLPGRELDQTVAHQLTVLKTRFKKA